MPPRYVYWTIVIDGTPTAFRSNTRDELLPTLKQIQRTVPGAVMKWYARGRVWDTPDEAARALRDEAAQRRRSRRPRHPGDRASRARRQPSNGRKRRR
jgi:hypothetical protein